MFTTFDNTNQAQHVLSPPVEPVSAAARARDTAERGFFCSVCSGADRGATTNRRPPRLSLPHALNP
jgi:hypothetical protein